MRVVIVDGHPAMRAGLAVLLVGSGMRVVGECASGEEAVRLVREERPHLAVLGLNPAGQIEGVEICRSIKMLPGDTRILVHTTYSFDEDISSSFLAGADSYLHKSASREEIVDAVKRTADGESVWHPGDGDGESRGRLDETFTGEHLTKREKQILALILRGYPNIQIARELHIELPTVKTHMRNILRKLGFKNRRELLLKIDHKHQKLRDYLTENSPLG